MASSPLHGGIVLGDYPGTPKDFSSKLRRPKPLLGSTQGSRRLPCHWLSLLPLILYYVSQAEYSALEPVGRRAAQWELSLKLCAPRTTPTVSDHQRFPQYQPDRRQPLGGRRPASRELEADLKRILHAGAGGDLPAPCQQPL